MANLEALRAAVFFAICENLRGADNRPPTVRGIRSARRKYTRKHPGLIECILVRTLDTLEGS